MATRRIPVAPDEQSAPKRSAASEGDTILAGSVYALLSKFVGAGFTALLTLYLVRALGPSGYGDFALAVGVGTLIALPADFGVSSSTSRFVAENRGRPAALAALVADAVRLKLITSLVVSGALIALSGPIAAAYGAPLTWPLRFIAIAVAGQNFMFLFLGAFVAVRRNATTVTIAFGESAAEFGTSLALVLLGAGATGAAAGRAIGYSVGGLLALALGAHALRWPLAYRRRGRQPSTGRIVRYAIPLMLVDGANALFSSIDLLLIGVFLDTRHVGLFSAPLRLLILFGYPGLAIASAVGPRMARTADRQPDAAALARALRLLVLIQSFAIVPLIVWAHPIVRIALGERYRGSISTVEVLSISVYLSGFAPLLSISANYLGAAARRIPLMISAVVLDGLIDVILIPRIGIVSGAIATAAAYGLMVAGHVAICRRYVRLELIPVGRSAGRALLAAAAMAGVLAAFGTDPPPLMLVAGAVLGTLVFVLALIAVGELSRRELTSVWRGVRSRLVGARAR